MAAIVGALRAVLSLDSAAFTKGVKSAQGDMSGLRKSMAAIGKNLKIAGAAMTAASTGVALTIKGQLDAADEMSKSAQKFGVPIESLSKLKYAADMSGVAMGTLGTGLQKLSRNMDAAASGNKKAAAMFKEMNIEVKNADGTLRDTEAVLGDVADVLAKMPDGAAKTALAMEVFGKSGAELIPMLNGGKTALQALTDEAASLGIVIDAKTGKAAENFNDNISRLKTAIGGLVVQLTAALAPTLEMISEKMVDATKWFRDLSPETQTLAAKFAVVAMAAGPLVLGLGFVVSSLGSVVLAIRAVTAAMLLNPFGLIITAVVAAAAAIYYYWEPISGFFTDLWAGITSTATAAWDGIKGLSAAAVAGTLAAWDGIKAVFGLVLSNVAAAFVEGWEAIKAEVSTWPARFIEFGGQIVDGLKQGILDKWDSMMASLRGKWDDLKNGFADALGIRSPSRVFRGYGQNITEGLAIGIGENAPMVGEAMDEVGAALKGSNGSLESGLDSLKSTIENVFVGLVTGSMKAKDAVRQLAQQLAQMLAKAAFSKLWGGVLSAIGFADGGVFQGGKVQAFAKGGVVAGATAFAMQGGLGVMGEAGPEAIMPLKRGADGRLGVEAAGGAGGVLEIRLSPELEAHWLQKAAMQSVHVTRAGAQQQQKAFGQTAQSYNARGTTG
ncbi:phage tail tape measure protein [Pseudotabrizicola sp. 4114]|uniref:phage tail tape measure protein n=1 Tax=Pseudotabrizicola sp. 4114 TaxID=2817731 RepID=UPI00285546D0|nr:TP901 family phage tail tape measure protein [Pseudorhodobacter sp. 4114]